MLNKKKIRFFIEKITGRRIFRILPLGVDFSYDIKFRFPEKQFKVIFDVGANVGQSTRVFVEEFPKSMIYTFEPSAATFEKLKANLAKYNNITYCQMALGPVRQDMQLMHDVTSDLNRIIKKGDEIFLAENAEVETIQMQTLTGYCSDNNISHIDYLKIDTEGLDLQVLKSGHELLENGQIDFIETEAGMNSLNTLHVPLEEIKNYLESLRYYLFGIYEQVHEWKTNQYILRRCNAVFISGKFLSDRKTNEN